MPYELYLGLPHLGWIAWPWAEAGSDATQSIGYCVISSLLVLQLEVESGQGSNPSVTSSI